MIPFRSSLSVAWFTFDAGLSGGPGSGLIFSNNNSTVSVEGWEHRVALGSVGFSRGIHYWEFTIDNYTADTDPAFGVARIDVNRHKMLGKLKMPRILLTFLSFKYLTFFRNTLCEKEVARRNHRILLRLLLLLTGIL